jgi:hypothetical protein
MNKNLPPLTIFVRNEFIYKNKEGFTEARLVGIRALSNQSIQFTVLLSNGALYTGLPPHALCFKQNAPKISLEESLMWDNISSEIDVITFDLLRYTPCTVKTINDKIIEGIYRFTIDYVGNNDLSRDPEHWKMTHVIESNDGNMLIYPQYRILFLDPALCFDKEKNFSDINYNTTIWMVRK